MAMALTGVLATPSLAGQRTNPVRELQQRQREQLAQDRLDRFVEDTYEFFEISGELISFRVHPDMTETELEMLDDRARELDEQAGRLLSYVRGVAPYVRGKTDDLWIVLDPPDESSTLEERLTLMLALVNRLLPKLDQVVTQLRGETAPTVSVEELQLEASAPYFVVGGLEELRQMTRELRAAL